MSFSLTPNQDAALHAEGNVLVTAAAGSGKTRVLTQRIVRAVLDQGAAISSIVAVTFTDRAAQEIRMRVGHELQLRGHFDLVAELDHAPIGTIHSYCRRLVSRYGTAIGVDPRIQMMDTTRASWAFTNSIRAALAELTRSDPRVARLRVRWEDPAIIKLIHSAYAAAQSRRDGFVAFTDPAGEIITHEGEDMAALDLLYEASMHRYQAACRAAGVVDFDGIQRRALQLLEIDAIRTAVRADVSRVLVDEFQDTNSVQCAILDAIGDGCTFTVGDECQSIYRFRGADVGVFRSRRDSGTYRVLGMPENFRSQQHVIDVVNGVFSRAFSGTYQHVVAAGAPVEPVTDHPSCEMVVAIADIKSDARHTEASHMARRVVELLDAGVPAGDIALVFPFMTQASIYVDALTACGVPTVRSSSRGYHRQDAVRDLVNLLSWVNNPVDDRSLLGVLASPLAGLGPGDMLKLRRHAGSDAPIWTSVVAVGRGPLPPGIPQHIRDACVSIVELHGVLSGIRQRGTLVDLVDHAVHGSGLAEYALAGPDGLRAHANLRRLLEMAHVEYQRGLRHLDVFVELLRMQGFLDTEGEASLAEEGSDAVRVLTIHASKGLEFPHVFICDLGNSGSSDHGPLIDDDGTMWTKRWDADGITKREPARYQELLTRAKAAAADEQRRLLYVGMTRAEQTLWCSAAATPTRKGTLSLEGPITWMIDAIDVDIDQLDGEMTHATLPLVVRTTRQLEPHRRVAVDQVQQRVMPEIDHPLLVPLSASTAMTDDSMLVESDEMHDVVHDSMLAVGEQLHELLAARLSGHQIAIEDTDTGLVSLIDDVVESDVWTRLQAADAHAEVPWHAVLDGEVVSGRFDALAIIDDAWWIVDWKRTLPVTTEDAWALHGEQFQRYMRAAYASGARRVVLTAVSIQHPRLTHAWALDGLDGRPQAVDAGHAAGSASDLA
jgi:ATP-dependent helicase/nuclease subunit A